MKTKTLFVGAFLFTAACGISDKTLLADLEPEDQTKLCEGSKEEEFVCEDGGLSLTITFGGDSCADGFAVTDDCTATVGDWRSCDDAWRTALNDDPCADIPAECDWIFECAGLSG